MGTRAGRRPFTLSDRWTGTRGGGAFGSFRTVEYAPTVSYYNFILTAFWWRPFDVDWRRKHYCSARAGRTDVGTARRADPSGDLLYRINRSLFVPTNFTPLRSAIRPQINRIYRRWRVHVPWTNAIFLPICRLADNFSVQHSLTGRKLTNRCAFNSRAYRSSRFVRTNRLWHRVSSTTIVYFVVFG